MTPAIRGLCSAPHARLRTENLKVHWHTENEKWSLLLSIMIKFGRYGKEDGLLESDFDGFNVPEIDFPEDK